MLVIIVMRTWNKRLIENENEKVVSLSCANAVTGQDVLIGAYKDNLSQEELALKMAHSNLNDSRSDVNLDISNNFDQLSQTS